MAARWNKGREISPQRRKKISIGRLNSPKVKALKEAARIRRVKASGSNTAKAASTGKMGKLL